MGRPPSPASTRLGLLLRERRGSTIGADVAASLGIHPNTYYRIERGDHRPGFATALVLARWLGCSVEEVMGPAGEKAAPR